MVSGNASWNARGIVLAVAVLAVACGANLRAPAQTGPQGGSVEWHLTFHLSGGFAGFNRTLELGNTGNITATDRRIGQKMATATAKELSDINALVTGLKPLDRRDPNCRDCIAYTLDVQRNGQTIALRFDDTALQDSTVGKIVQTLTGILDRTLAGRSPE